MKVRARAPLFVLAALFAIACRKAPKPAPSAAASSAGTQAPVSKLDPELDELHQSSTRGRKDDFQAVASAGPSARSSPVVERERAVLALFGSGSPAERLPVVAVDRGHEFEIALRHVVAKGGFDPAPAASLFDVEVNGGLASAEVEKVLATRLVWYEACFVPSLRQDPKATGAVTLRWNVGPKGDATGVWVAKAELLADDVTHCVVRHSHGLSFPPPPEGSARVTASVQLGPRKVAGNPNLPRGLTH